MIIRKKSLLGLFVFISVVTVHADYQKYSLDSFFQAPINENKDISNMAQAVKENMTELAVTVFRDCGKQLSAKNQVKLLNVIVAAIDYASAELNLRTYERINPFFAQDDTLKELRAKLMEARDVCAQAVFDVIGTQELEVLEFLQNLDKKDLVNFPIARFFLEWTYNSMDLLKEKCQALMHELAHEAA